MHPFRIGLSQCPGRLHIDILVAGKDAAHPCFQPLTQRQFGEGRAIAIDRFPHCRQQHRIGGIAPPVLGQRAFMVLGDE